MHSDLLCPSPHPSVLAPAQAGALRYPVGCFARGTGEFPIKHHHEMNSATLLCCLWKHRNPNQTAPRQAQHALKSRGVHQLWQKAAQSHTAPSSSPSAPGHSQAGGTASPLGSSHPWDGTWPSGQPARDTVRANTNCVTRSDQPSPPHPSPWTQLPPQCHFRAKTI